MGSPRTLKRRAQRRRRLARQLAGVTRRASLSALDRVAVEILRENYGDLFIKDGQLLTYLKDRSRPRTMQGPVIGRVPFDWEKDPPPPKPPEGD